MKADLKDMPLIVTSRHECIRKCNDEIQCKAITYRKRDRNCWLKSKDNGEKILRIPGLKSANKNCFKGIQFCTNKWENFIVLHI